MPFRSDVHKVIEGLSRQTNELGLWTLALAANTFRSDDLPQNSVPKLSLTGKGDGPVRRAALRLSSKVDLAAEDRIARDAAGVPVPLYEWDVVAASDPDRVTTGRGAVVGRHPGAGPRPAADRGGRRAGRRPRGARCGGGAG